jgi:AGZA family xanthine/uracil permease-like MFS transporter
LFAAIIAALGMTADGLAEGLYAVRHRFSARAASIGYAIGAAVGWFYNLVTPITFTVESITIATRAVKKPPQILYVVALSAVPSIVLGLLGLYSTFVNWLDPGVVAGVVAGVGVILAGVGVGYIRDRPFVAVPSVTAGVVGYALTDNLVAVILVSLAAGTTACHLVPDRLRWGAEENGEQGAEDVADADEDSDKQRIRIIPFD